MLSERLRRMKERYFDTMPNITAEHLELTTQAYQMFAGEAAPIFRAKVAAYILENMTVCINPDELVVGSRPIPTGGPTSLWNSPPRSG